MSKSIVRAEREVQAALSSVMKCAEIDGTERLHEVEARLWTALMALGRAVLVLFMTRYVARPQAVTYEHGSHRYALDSKHPRVTELGTRFGKIPFTRPVGRRIGRPSAACDLPVDRQLRLCGGFSLGTVLAITRLCAQMAFGTARETFAQSHEWSPSSRSVLRMVDAVGSRARGFLEQCPAPDDDGEILFIQADGRGAPMINSAEHRRRRQPHRRRPGTKRTGRRLRRRERPRARRTKGQKSKNAKVAVVGVIYTLRKTRHGMEGPINKRMIGTFESHEALFIWLRREADKRGYGSKRTIFLGDGSDHLWRNQLKYFPGAEVCLDWYHVMEKLWIAGECQFPEGSAELRSWINAQTKRLRAGRVGQVLDELARAYAAIPKTGPGNKGRRKRLHNVLNFLTDQRHRMRYHRLRRDGLDIGTGAVEGAVRNLVGLRLDGPGMRWGRDRSELVLHLRCILLNGQWRDFAAYLARLHLPLAAAPAPARTHDAKPQKPQQLREAA